jgi:hypothetical protein
MKSGDEYYRFYKIEWRPNGLYVIDNSPGASHFSYHSGGNCFYHSGGFRHCKKIRKPLNEFEGIESLLCANIVLFDISNRVTKKSIIKSEDLVFDRRVPFCFEIILSKDPFELPSLPERKNSEVHQKKIGHLYLTVEVFENTTKYIADTRYNPNIWVIGENFFSFIDGKWQ